MSEPILSLTNVSMRFTKSLDAAEKIANLIGAGLEEVTVHAVDNVSLDIEKGEVVGLVGESGCGKSTLGRVVAGIYQPSEGEVFFRGKRFTEMSDAERRDAALKVQMIFQDPMSALNPRMRVSEIVGEAPAYHNIIPRAELSDALDALMMRVGLDPAYKKRYPHQFSGGQRQRINIARALAVEPDFLVCDESVAALDVSIQAQIINLFMQLREDLDLTYLFISHDLGVVEHISDRVVIMYLGRIVEIASTETLFETPNHPYTQALLAEVPRLDQRKRTFAAIKGEIPSPIHPPSGCHFHPRCPHAFDRCREERPLLRQVEPGHMAACHLNEAPRGKALDGLAA
ncbi:MAG: ABC transporter ATP-binding protein [Pseudomonadota bacterium]